MLPVYPRYDLIWEALSQACVDGFDDLSSEAGIQVSFLKLCLWKKPIPFYSSEWPSQETSSVTLYNYFVGMSYLDIWG